MSQTNEQCISIYSFENFRIEVTGHFGILTIVERNLFLSAREDLEKIMR